jgi:hypothetical protein
MLSYCIRILSSWKINGIWRRILFSFSSRLFPKWIEYLDSFMLWNSNCFCKMLLISNKTTCVFSTLSPQLYNDSFIYRSNQNK